MTIFENKYNRAVGAFQMERGGPPVSHQILGPSYFIFYCVPPASQLLPSINYPRGPLYVSPPTFAASITIGVLLCLFMEVTKIPP